MKRKIKIIKKIKLFLSLILAIIVSYTTITLFKAYEQDKYNFFVPTFNEKIDSTARKLEELHYSNEEIKTIKKYVSNKSITYIIDNKINKKIILGFINEKYYIDAYLENYINYYEYNQDKSFTDVVTIINTHTDNPLYENTMKTDTTKGIYVILNKYYYTDNQYPADNLVTIDKKYQSNNNDLLLNKEAYNSYIKLIEEASNNNFKYKIKNAYESFENQEKNYNESIKNQNNDLTKPGHSDYQTALSIDIVSSSNEATKWLQNNAHKYGYILRYPENKESITGFEHNQEHYRYCGIQCATYIYENNITYEEYYEYFIKYNNPQNLN